MASVQDDQEHTDRESLSELESEQEEAEVSGAEETEEDQRKGSEADLGCSSLLDSKQEKPATVKESDVLRALKNRPQGLSLKDIKNIVVQDNVALEKLPAKSVKSQIMSALDKVIEKGQAVKQKLGMNFMLLQTEEAKQIDLGSRRERKRQSRSRSSKTGNKRKSGNRSRRKNSRKLAKKRASARSKGNRRKSRGKK